MSSFAIDDDAKDFYEEIQRQINSAIDKKGVGINILTPITNTFNIAFGQENGEFLKGIFSNLTLIGPNLTAKASNGEEFKTALSKDFGMNKNQMPVFLIRNLRGNQVIKFEVINVPADEKDQWERIYRAFVAIGAKAGTDKNQRELLLLMVMYYQLNYQVQNGNGVRSKELVRQTVINFTTFYTDLINQRASISLAVQSAQAQAMVLPPPIVMVPDSASRPLPQSPININVQGNMVGANMNFGTQSEPIISFARNETLAITEVDMAVAVDENISRLDNVQVQAQIQRDREMVDGLAIVEMNRAGSGSNDVPRGRAYKFEPYSADRFGSYDDWRRQMEQVADDIINTKLGEVAKANKGMNNQLHNTVNKGLDTVKQMQNELSQVEAKGGDMQQMQAVADKYTIRLSNIVEQVNKEMANTAEVISEYDRVITDTQGVARNMGFAVPPVDPNSMAFRVAQSNLRLISELLRSVTPNAWVTFGIATVSVGSFLIYQISVSPSHNEKGVASVATVVTQQIGMSADKAVEKTIIATANVAQDTVKATENIANKAVDNYTNYLYATLAIATISGLGIAYINNDK